MVRLASVTLTIAVAIGLTAASAQTDGKSNSKFWSMAGVVKTVSGSSLTLERKDSEIVFSVDSSTRVIGKGMARDLLLRKPPHRFTDLVKAGDQVAVKYRQSGSAIYAVEVRVVQR